MNGQKMHEGNLLGEEGLSFIFGDDVLAPHHYLVTLTRKSTLEPEKRLLLAVLQDAISCFQKNSHAARPRQRRLFRETEAWIFQSGPESYFSFETICEVLGLNPHYIRRGLQSGPGQTPPEVRTRRGFKKQNLSSESNTTKGGEENGISRLP